MLFVSAVGEIAAHAALKIIPRYPVLLHGSHDDKSVIELSLLKSKVLAGTRTDIVTLPMFTYDGEKEELLILTLTVS